MNIQKNSSGKVFVIFLVIFVVLSLSLAGLTMFFLSKEKERRKATEISLEQSVNNATKLEAKLQDANKQGSLLQEKLKEADERIENLLAELELQQGIAEEVKKENQKIKENLAGEIMAKEDLQAQLEILVETGRRIPILEAELQTQQGARQELEQKLQASEQRIKELEETIAKQPSPTAPSAGLSAAEQAGQVELETIVVSPDAMTPDQSTTTLVVKQLEGRVVTVDIETEFAIVNLGANHGIREGQILSVLRGEDRVGDIKVTRVQPEISAADFVPPLSGNQIHKDDRVTTQ